MEAHERTLARLYDIKKLKMGRLPAKVNLRAPRLQYFLTADLPPPPVSINWGAAVTLPWGMLKNDDLGDCTAAAAGHAIQTWTANASVEAVITDTMTVDFYEKTTGYTPGQPNTDQGGVELDVLQWWHAHKFGGLYGLEALAIVDPKRSSLVKSAIALMGGVYIGVALPTSAQNQPVWDVPASGTAGDGTPGSWGLHAIWIMAYDEVGLTCVTWGQVWKMTWAFFSTYCDEAYALLSSLWYVTKSPTGLDAATLRDDMAHFQQVDPPSPAPDPGPTPPICEGGDMATAAEGGDLINIHVGNITVSVSQAAANLIIIIIGTGLLAMGKFDVTSLSAWIGGAITVVSAATHLRAIKKSNDATINYYDKAMHVISLLKAKVAKK